MSIRENCMVVNLQIGVWLGYRLDKDASRKVTTDANASDDAARVNKHIVPKESLAKIVSASGAIRNYFYGRTLPWKDNGDRLLVRRSALTFFPEHGALVDAFKTEVGEFLDRGYPAAIERAEFRMGTLFNPDDYPPTAQIERKFYVNLDVDGIADAFDERLETNDAAIQSRVSKAMAGLYERLNDKLTHFAERMDGDSVFRDSTLDNLQEIVKLLPELNFMDDPNLTAIGEAIDTKLMAYGVKDLRKYQGIRAAVADDAKTIMDQMAGFMRAFGQ